MDFLKRHDFTRDMETVELVRLAARLRREDLQPGDTLCEQGEPTAGLFLVSEGTIEILMRPAPRQEPVSITVLVAPTVIGEMELISGQPSICTARARSLLVAYTLAHAEFKEMVATWDSTAAKILRNSARLVVRRIAASNARLLEAIDPAKRPATLTEAFSDMWGSGSGPAGLT